MGAFLRIVDAIQQRKQAVMELGDAVEFERDGCALKSETAEDVCGQVAAVDRQSCRAGQNEWRCCSHCYKGICFVLFHIRQWIFR